MGVRGSAHHVRGAVAHRGARMAVAAVAVVVSLTVGAGLGTAGASVRNAAPVERNVAPVGRAASASRAAPVGAPSIDGCPMFPANNVWNTRVDTLPVHARSDAWIASIGASTGLRADFGSGLWEDKPIGIPYVTVSGSQPEASVTFEYADESDPGPYRIPPDAPVEGGDDHHVIVLDRDTCQLAEVFDATQQSAMSWTGGSGAIFDLRSNAFRPDGWTSADAAGLPILPGLARYDEVAAGEIAHALRFTVQRSQRAYVWPARHFASNNTDPNLPPMGARARLKQGVDISTFPRDVQVILLALKRYGMFVADNGSNWYISGAPDDRWNDDELRTIRQIVGNNLEFVDQAPLMVHPDSGEVAPGSATAGP